MTDGECSGPLRRALQKCRSISDPSCQSLKSNWSKALSEVFSSEQVEPDPKLPKALQHLDSIFKLLQEDVVAFVHEKLKKLHKLLSSGPSECEVFMDDEDEEERTVSEAFLSITVSFLRRRQQQELAERLWSGSHAGVIRRKLKTELQQRYQHVSEGVAKAGDPALLQEIYTELYITKGGASEVSQEHEVRHLETASRRPGRAETIECQDIFRSPDTEAPVRTVLTKGVAGVGKTLLTQKFSLDWAQDKANQDVLLLFPFTFRALNVLRDRSFSLVQLLHHFFTPTEELHGLGDLKVIFIFDGLDESRLPLDFCQTRVLTEPTESASVEELLVNLIRGNLLPSARLWITTRPAAASQVPAECVSMVTEVRGFTDRQKEQYFRKRFSDEQQFTAVISHIKSIQSLFIMCHIPVFCWILSVVLHKIMELTEKTHLPKTLTEMYVHLLVVQAKVKNIKYHEGTGADLHWTSETREMVQCLGKLAFEQLQKGNLIFYENDLRESGLDAAEVARYSGVFTQFFKEETGLYQDKVYCFIHLSVQEFLAALHVHQTFFNTGVNLLSDRNQRATLRRAKPKLKRLHRSAVDQALQSPNGHLDLFLRFLLGLSLQSNQKLLRGLLVQTEDSSQTNQKTANLIHQKLSEEVSPERSINLLHCLNELNDRSLVEQIQRCLSSGHLSELSPAQWSALAFILLSSEEDLDQFEMKKYSASEEALLRLLPVVKASNKALLNCCNLSESSCEALSSVLSSSRLTVLDLSNNDLKDSGLTMLSAGLRSPLCKLQQLSLSGCLITVDGCAALASALRSNPSSLTHLDLSFNHPGAVGADLLCALQKELHSSLHTLRLQPAGSEWLTPGLRKYSRRLSLDPNTAHGNLSLLNSKSVTYRAEEQMFPNHVDRFEPRPQLLCGAGLSGRCYWEVRWSGVVCVAASYRGIRRKGERNDSGFGLNEQSWCLECSKSGLSFWHNNQQTVLPQPWFTSSGTVAVYVDHAAGSLSFYAVSSDGLTLLHTTNTTFSEPLVPGFGFLYSDSSVTLLD